MPKTYKNLWPQLVSFENLLLAAKKAQKGKRFKENTALFNLNLEKELFRLQEELITKTYTPGCYKEFIVCEPVRRLISAAPYRDRVAHHALCNVIGPLFERSFIYDSYANREGKGTHKAIGRFREYMRRYRFVLKCDIRKYFPSIDHEILFGLMRRKINDPDVLWLIKTIIDGSNPQEPVHDYFVEDDLFAPHERRKGLPIGNLTSQFFANVYLDAFDHYVQETLSQGAYLRYVDDFAVFGNDKEHLWSVKRLMDCYLEKLRLLLHPVKTRVLPVKAGCEFLGFFLYPHIMRVKKTNVGLFVARLKNMKNAFKTGKMSTERITKSVQGWIAHVKHAQSHGLRESIFKKYALSR